jgi:hypothetical protein
MLFMLVALGWLLNIFLQHVLYTIYIFLRVDNINKVWYHNQAKVVLKQLLS